MDLRKRLGELRENKKGSIQDLILMAVVATFFGIIMLISFTVVAEFSDILDDLDSELPGGVPTEAKRSINQLENTYTGIIDNMFVFLIIGLSILAFVLAALVRIHPMFIAFYFLALILVVYLAGILSNIYTGMAANPALIAQANQLTFITLILNFLPLFVGALGTALMFVMYKLWSNSI